MTGRNAGLVALAFLAFQVALLADEVDTDLVEQIYESTQITESTPSPGPVAYTGHLWGELLRRMLFRGGDLATKVLGIPLAVWKVLIYLVAIGCLLILGARLRRLWRHRSTVEPEVPGVLVTEDEMAKPEEWLQRFRDALAAGDTTTALECVWWWAATTVAPRGLAGSWSTFDMARAPEVRPEVVPVLRDVDLLAFSPRPASTVEVQALQQRLAQALP